MSEQSKRESYLRQAWLVILLGLVYGGALAGVETTLRDRIADNKMQETYDRIPYLVPGADRDKTEEVNKAEKVVLTGTDGKEQQVYLAVAADGTQKGWVLPASGQGFADRIDLLIGLDAHASTITGLYVLDQKETPGLGSFITSEELFLSQFAGRSADEPLVVVKTDPAAGSNQIRALSGATISSESVSAIVNQAIANFKEPIRRYGLAGNRATTLAPPAPDRNVDY
jgi:electron transport complex protein RnfG